MLIDRVNFLFQNAEVDHVIPKVFEAWLSYSEFENVIVFIASNCPGLVMLNDWKLVKGTKSSSKMIGKILNSVLRLD